MITKENLKEVLSDLSNKEVSEAINNDGDYVLIVLHVFNVGTYTTITSLDYNTTLKNGAEANGDLFCDKDDFLRLSEEVDIDWEL